MYNALNTPRVALMSHAQSFDQPVISDHGVLSSERGATAQTAPLQLCMNPPIADFSLVANICRDDSTLKKMWGAYRRKDGSKQDADKSGHENQRSARGIDAFAIRSGDQTSGNTDDLRSERSALSNPQFAAMTMPSMARGTTDSVRRH